MLIASVRLRLIIWEGIWKFSSNSLNSFEQQMVSRVRVKIWGWKGAFLPRSLLRPYLKPWFSVVLRCTSMIVTYSAKLLLSHFRFTFWHEMTEIVFYSCLYFSMQSTKPTYYTTVSVCACALFIIVIREWNLSMTENITSVAFSLLRFVPCQFIVYLWFAGIRISEYPLPYRLQLQGNTRFHVAMN